MSHVPVVAVVRLNALTFTDTLLTVYVRMLPLVPVVAVLPANA